jgi:hypothetical protein
MSKRRAHFFSGEVGCGIGGPEFKSPQGGELSRYLHREEVSKIQEWLVNNE